MTIYFDISTVARRTGPPGGISRVEREYARYALKHRPDIRFSFFDISAGAFREANRNWISELVGTEYRLDTSRIDTRQARRLQRLPSPLRGGAFWLRRFRHNVQVASERIRLTTSRAAVRHLAEQVLSLARNGTKPPSPPVLPFDLAIGEEIALDPDCVLVSVGNDWSYKDIKRIAALKACYRFRYVVLCHDLIILQFPHLAGERAVEHFRNYWHHAFPLADVVIFSTRTVESDVREHCRTHDLPLGETAVVRLGWNPSAGSASPEIDLPEGIEPGKYILFVSALEARKGHEMIMAVWKRLLEEGVPQRLGFKLVFVGGYMFNTPRLKQYLLNREMGDTLRHFHDILDDQLTVLYRQAGFCVYPSQYEGFGLPVIESFGAGTPIIVSTGGAVPEIAAGLAPCIDASDTNGWYAEIKRWLEDSTIRDHYALKIADHFSMPTWDESGQKFFGEIQRATAKSPE